MFAVTVRFRIKPGKMSDFLTHMRKNAGGALRTEPGCRRFDICTDPDRPDEAFLYELYDDADAFAAHKQTPHFAAIGAVAPEFVESRDLSTWSMVETDS
ncbi:MAG: putative quinol monooxygenase [Pseudorhodobacter sp.]